MSFKENKFSAGM